MTVPFTDADGLHRSRLSLVGQTLAAGSLLALAITLLVSGPVARRWEARWIAPVYDLMTPGDTLVVGERLYDNVSTNDPIAGLQLSFMCSAVVLAVPLLVQAALMLVLGRFSPWRVGGALCVSLPLVLLVNAVRIGTIGWARNQWGRAGFDISHHLVAALVALAGFVLAVVIQVRLSVAGDQTPRGRAGA